MKTFYTVFPKCENIHLIKDVGMIPYIMQSYYGYCAYIVGYAASDDMCYLDSAVKGLHYISINNTGNEVRDFGKFIVQNAKKIDVLQLYHVTTNSNYRWIFLYKLFNSKGKVYLKLDAGEKIFEEFDFHKRDIKTWGKRFLLRRCKLISAETKNLAERLTENWGIQIHYITNGFFDYGKRIPVSYTEKKNIICTVGRLGTRQKNTEELMEAFAIFSKTHPDWVLRLCGSMEKDFEKYIEKFQSENPECRDKVIFCGVITDREQLRKEYAQAKIFCLTSRWESFAIVFAEALQNGCYIISSNIDGAKEKTDNEKYGTLYPIEDKAALIQALENVLKSEAIISAKCGPAQEFAYQNYYWPNICKELDTLLR